MNWYTRATLLYVLPRWPCSMIYPSDLALWSTRVTLLYDLPRSHCFMILRKVITIQITNISCLWPQCSALRAIASLTSTPQHKIHSPSILWVYACSRRHKPSPCSAWVASLPDIDTTWHNDQLLQWQGNANHCGNSFQPQHTASYRAALASLFYPLIRTSWNVVYRWVLLPCPLSPTVTGQNINQKVDST